MSELNIIEPNTTEPGTTKLLRLDIGSGYMPMKGWTTLDLYVKADLKEDIRALTLGDSSVDQIRCEHTLEHLAERDVPIAMKELYRVLKHGGKFSLYLPDLTWTLEQFLKCPESNRDKWGVWWRRIFGSQIHEGEFHLTGFTLTKAIRQTKDAGFEIEKAAIVFSYRHNQPEIQIEAVK